MPRRYARDGSGAASNAAVTPPAVGHIRRLPVDVALFRPSAEMGLPALRRYFLEGRHGNADAAGAGHGDADFRRALATKVRRPSRSAN